MNIIHEGRPINILLVEDNPADVRLLQETLKETKVGLGLHVAVDGFEAMRYLNREGDFSNAPLPDLIILDLNLPRMDGREVLEKIKSDNRTKRIPVVVLTTSQAEEDIVRTYNLHVNCYITKPLDLEQFIKVIKTIEEFWFTIVRLPPPDQ